MTTTATALRTSGGAVVVPSYAEDKTMFGDKKDVSAIVARVVPSEDRPGAEPEDGAEVSEGLLAAAEDVMDVLSSCGMSMPSSDSKNEVEQAATDAAKQAKAKMLARALGAFLDLYGQD